MFTLTISFGNLTSILSRFDINPFKLIFDEPCYWTNTQSLIISSTQCTCTCIIINSSYECINNRATFFYLIILTSVCRSLFNSRIAQVTPWTASEQTTNMYMNDKKNIFLARTFPRFPVSFSHLAKTEHLQN